MIRLLVSVFFLCIVLSCQAQKKSKLVLGAEQLTDITQRLNRKASWAGC